MSATRPVSALLLAILVGTAGAPGPPALFRGLSRRVPPPTGAVPARGTGPATHHPAAPAAVTTAAPAVSRTTAPSTPGDFSVPALPLGAYTIEAALQGFQTVRTKVEVSVSQIAAVELKMGLSTVAETVNVTASALMLDTVSTALSNVVRPKQVQDLPLNGRDFTRMLQLAPGVAGNSVHGVRTRGNHCPIDGADTN